MPASSSSILAEAVAAASSPSERQASPMSHSQAASQAHSAFAPDTDEPSSDDSETPSLGRKATTERVFAEALVALRDDYSDRYTALATTQDAIRSDLKSHIASSGHQYSSTLKVLQTLGDGIFELHTTILAKDKIDEQRMLAWKDELNAVAAQAGKNTAELVVEDSAQRKHLDSLHEVVDQQQEEVKKTSLLARQAMTAAAIRIGIIVTVVLLTYKAVAHAFVKGWLVP